MKVLHLKQCNVICARIVPIFTLQTSFLGRERFSPPSFSKLVQQIALQQTRRVGISFYGVWALPYLLKKQIDLLTNKDLAKTLAIPNRIANRCNLQNNKALMTHGLRNDISTDNQARDCEYDLHWDTDRVTVQAMFLNPNITSASALLNARPRTCDFLEPSVLKPLKICYDNGTHWYRLSEVAVEHLAVPYISFFVCA